ncbi:MAG: hypothetical protein NVS9B12_10530 [Vulcanimicrobiaceae bacterium]
MPRVKGSGTTGSVRSLRLPKELDAWFEERLREEPSRSATDLLLTLIHGGLRLRPGYMIGHRRALELLVQRSDPTAFEVYLGVLRDTFGYRYVHHLQKWLESDGIVTVNNNGQKKSISST